MPGLLATAAPVEPTIDVIVGAARTGEVGAGKIIVPPLQPVVRIRTGEADSEALTPVPVVTGG